MRIASANIDGEISDNKREEIYRGVEKLRQPDQLVTLALMCKAILGSQAAGDEPFDVVFDVTFWHCVTLLSNSTSDEAVRALHILKEESRTDAGSTLMFEEAILRQQKRIKKKGEPRQ